MSKNNSTTLNVVITCIIFYCFVLTQSVPEDALVTHIPGFSGSVPSKHYAGYVTVDENHGRELYYYFVESERNPSKDPVVLWLNGGPGCSSLGGFVYEHGPFNFEKGKSRDRMPTLHLNPYSWSKVSNIIYLDSPAGVGYSYSRNTSDYVTGDKKTALDSHTFLLKWFKLYPEFLANPFYIAGESYGGVYVPTLAYEVVKGIDASMKPVINFKGYMVGNGVISEPGYDGFVQFVHGMGLISDELYTAVSSACKGIYYKFISNDCENKLTKINQVTQGLNEYNILEPCYRSENPNKKNTGSSKLPQSFKRLGKNERPTTESKRMFGRAWPLRAITWPQLTSSNSVECFDDEAANSWLNKAEVRKAIHAQQESISGPWNLCTRLSYDWDGGSMIKYHKNLTSRGYRALIYSGDHDMVIPFTGTEAWTRSLGYKVVDEWRSWIVDQQVAGYLQGYENNLIFLTIKGSGHMVPQDKPRESLAFYKRWLEDEKI